MQVTIHQPAMPDSQAGKVPADGPAAVEQAFDIVLEVVAAMMQATGLAEAAAGGVPPTETDPDAPAEWTSQLSHDAALVGAVPVPPEMRPAVVQAAGQVIAEELAETTPKGATRAVASFDAPDHRQGENNPRQALPQPAAGVPQQADSQAREHVPVHSTAPAVPEPAPPAAAAATAAQAGVPLPVEAEADDLSSAMPRAAAAGPSSQPPPAQPMATARALPPEMRFVEQNHPTIVTAVRGQLLPNGGTMQIRLDPPQLGTIQLVVRLHDGVMQASFHTSSDEATRLLGHTLGQLKTSLEAAGVTVDRLAVQQSLRNEGPNNRSDQQSQENPREQQQQQGGSQQEQQRRELLQRMWQRLALGEDPLDLVA